MSLHGKIGASVVILMLAIVAPALSAAASCLPEQTLRMRGMTARMENDLFVGTDRNYTNGVSLALVSHDIRGQLEPRCLPAPLALYARFINRADTRFGQRASAAGTTQNLVLRLGQSMYTPRDRTRRDLIEDDRPYAGLLYMGLAWNRRVPLSEHRYEMLETRELTLGIIGPASLARDTQNMVHDLRGIDRFNGWSNQLHNEPALQVALERKYKAYQYGAFKPGWSHNFVGRWGVHLGNIQTATNIGLEWRAGWNIPNDFGSYPISAGAENRPPSAITVDDIQPDTIHETVGSGLHFFTNLDAKVVAYDFSLDGNLFRSSHSVSRRPLVLQAAMGVSAQWPVAGHGLRLAVMRVWRTREFRQQRGHHAFDSIALSLDF